MENGPWSLAVYLEAIKSFRESSQREVARVKRNLTGLSDDDKASLIWKPEDQILKMEEAVAANLGILEKIAELIRGAQQARAPQPPVHDGSAPQVGSKSVQALLQGLVREWAAEGSQERQESFTPLLGALDRHLQARLEQARASGAAPLLVMCPGAQFGRLPFEVQRRGYSCEACEARPLWYFAADFLRRQGSISEAHRIQPFVINTCNRYKQGDHIRVTPIPDVAIEDGVLPPFRFGEFTHLYNSASQVGRFDAVLTAFSLDTSPNVLRFVRTVAHIVKPGGLWANFGPLAYDNDHDEGYGHSMELSWEELRHAVSHFFEIKEEEYVDSLYAANAESMMQIQYTCVYFSAVRNDSPAKGIGEK